MIKYVNFTDDDINMLIRVPGYAELNTLRNTCITFCRVTQSVCIEGGVNRKQLKTIDKVLKEIEGMAK